MAINILSNYQNTQSSVLQKYHEIYKNKTDDNPVKSRNINQANDIELPEVSKKDLREYLSVDEKRVLKEVFGDFNVDKNNYTPYNHSQSFDLFKGSQIDVKL